MMNFEEQFPSMKQLRMQPSNSEAGDMYLDDEGEYIQVYDIEKYCLDKQRVKEAIEKHMVHGHSNVTAEHDIEHCRMCNTLKELGL